MRMLLAEGFTLVEVGDVFNLTFQTVSQIKLGKTWRHV
jgi:hypothetical protein